MTETAEGLGALTDALGPGLSTIILRTPLGIYWVDPFAPPDPTFNKIMSMLGISLELRVGPPTDEDLAAPKLSTSLVMVGGLLGAVAWYFFQSRKRPTSPLRRNPTRHRRVHVRRRRPRGKIIEGEATRL